jgi:hypothetical protein
MPPKTWRPDPAWPPAPEDWKFWVDGKGNPVRGPVGRYAGPSRRVVFAGAAGIALFLVMGLWMVSTLGLFDGKPQRVQAAQVIDDSTPSPTPTPVAPTTLPTAPPRVEKSTLKPSPKPTKTRTTKRTETTESTKPKPTKTTASTKPTRPTPSAHRPTREELLAEYCRQQGWPPEMCNPDNWSTHPNP